MGGGGAPDAGTPPARTRVQILDVATESSDNILPVPPDDHAKSRTIPDRRTRRGCANFAPRAPAKKLLLMKLFARFYVFNYEDRAKLHVAKKDHDHKFYKATSSAR